MTSYRLALRAWSLTVAVVAGLSSFALAGARSNGLSRSEQTQLEHFRYEVSPDVPPGFRVTKFSANANGFLIEYERPSDGAMFRITGSQASAARSTPAPAQKSHGLFANIGHLFGKVTHQQSSNLSQQGSAGEEEEQTTSMVIDNPYTGKYAVKAQGNCLHGDSDPSTAQYRNARYKVDGCNVNGDLFAHVVRSVKP